MSELTQIRIPKALKKRLAERAKVLNRSAQQELIAILEKEL